MLAAAAHVRRPMDTATLGAGDKRAKWEEMAGFRNIKKWCGQTSNGLMLHKTDVTSYSKTKKNLHSNALAHSNKKILIL